MNNTITPENPPTFEQEEEINLLDLLSVLVKRKSMIIKVTVIAALLSIGYSLTLPNIYQASSTVLPPGKDSGGGLAAALAGQAGALAGLAGVAGIGGPTDLYMSLLKSRSVTDAVIKRLDLIREFKSKKPDDARKKLEGKVKFQAGAKDGIITITATDKKPEMAATLVNTYVDELGKLTLRLNLSKASAERSFLEKRIEVVRQDLRAAEDALKDFSQKNKTVQVDSQAKASIEAVARLKAEMVTKEVQLSALRVSQTDESPEVKSLLTTISRLKREIGARSGSDGSGEGLPSVGSVPSLGVQYARLLRQVKVQEAVFEQLTKQFELAKLSEAKDSANIQVIDAAVAPDRKARPKRSMIVMLATISAFFASVMAAFLFEYLEKLPPEDRQRLEEMKLSLRPRLPWRSRQAS